MTDEMRDAQEPEAEDERIEPDEEEELGSEEEAKTFDADPIGIGGREEVVAEEPAGEELTEGSADEKAETEADEAVPEETPEAPSSSKRGGRVQPTEVSDELRRQVEALLFATEQPISARRVANVLKVREPLVRVAIHDLRAQYAREGHAFAVEEIAGGYQVLTRPDYGRFVKQLYEENRKGKLSQAALETLAIIAYKQPVMRVEVEDIRGVSISDVLHTLLDAGLVRVVGRAEVLGRPMLYGTTQKFLLMFGLKSPKDLPSVEELKKQL